MYSKICVVILAMCAVGAFGGHVRVERDVQTVAKKLLNHAKIQACLKPDQKAFMEDVCNNMELLSYLKNMKYSEASKMCTMSEMLKILNLLDHIDKVCIPMGWSGKLKSMIVNEDKVVDICIDAVLTKVLEYVEKNNLTSQQCNDIQAVLTVDLKYLIDLFCLPPKSQFSCTSK